MEKKNDIYSDSRSAILSDLQSLIRQPSVSAKKQGLVECANLVAQIMRKAGINSEVLYLDEEHDKDIPPVVYGEIKSKSNPDGKTLLFYNHYDVQPVEPLELWEADPFSGKIEGNFVFGRGAADDKGELVTRIKAVEEILKEKKDVPCNIKFIIEGEEEIGSIHIDKYLAKYKQKFSSNAVIWEFGYIDENDRPIISLGMKGLLYVELVAKGPSRDAHSSLAVLIENPAWRLVKALDTLRDDKGTIKIKGWYEDVRDFTDEELKLIQSEPFQEDEFKKEYGIEKFVNNMQGIEARKAFVGKPTCNIAGIVSGYIAEGAKTVLPSKAVVKIDFRLVPNMVPEKQMELLKNHLKDEGFDDISVRYIHGEAAARTESNDPFVKIVQKSAQETFGSAITSVSSAGTGPMYSFIKHLSAPCVSIGCTFVYSRIHSPNEFARIDLLYRTTDCIKRIIENFSSQ